MAKKSYLSSSARTTMQNTTFPGHSGKADPGAPSKQMVKDGLWTGRPDNSNFTKRVFIRTAPDRRYQGDPTKSLGICKPRYVK